MSGVTILVIEDDPAVSQAVAIGLAGYGFTPQVAATGAEGYRQAVGVPAPAVVLLDLGLPDEDGLALCIRIRAASAVPIIILTARGAEHEKVSALESGADDYVTKPFGLRELLARVRVALRHNVARAGPPPPMIRIGELWISLDHRQVARAGTPVHLTPTEFALLAALVHNAGRVCTHRMLLQTIRGAGYGADTALLRVYIAQLRAKLEPHAATPRYIQTEPGVGYRLTGWDEG